MEVFKFGGASIKDASSIKKMLQLIDSELKTPSVIVVSATENTTNTLEALHESYLAESEELGVVFDRIKRYHQELILELFPDHDHPIYKILEELFAELWKACCLPKSENVNLDHDRLVVFGELVSSTIISAYFEEQGVKNQWVDIRTCLKTDEHYNEANVLWEQSKTLVGETFSFTASPLYITQGFIASTENGNSTTLGREGSDYTAALLANMLEASSVTIWKAVDGVLTGDPDWFKTPQKIEHISYQEAIELAYYGAKVIHPKTIKPLRDKAIPLHVRSFINTNDRGTLVSHEETNELERQTMYIRKSNQVLMSVATNDYSFILEKNISEFFSLFARLQIKVNLIQNSALQFVFVTDYNKYSFSELYQELSKQYKVQYNTGLDLFTIRNYKPGAEHVICEGRQLFLQQQARNTAHFIVR